MYYPPPPTTAAEHDDQQAVRNMLRTGRRQPIGDDARLDDIFGLAPAADLCYIKAVLATPDGQARLTRALDLILAWRDQHSPKPNWAAMPADRQVREAMYQALNDAARYPQLDDVARAAEQHLRVTVERGPRFHRDGRKSLLSRLWLELAKLPPADRDSRVAKLLEAGSSAPART